MIASVDTPNDGLEQTAKQVYLVALVGSPCWTAGPALRARVRPLLNPALYISSLIKGDAYEH